jgi:hypothetical protein
MDSSQESSARKRSSGSNTEQIKQPLHSNPLQQQVSACTRQPAYALLLIIAARSRNLFSCQPVLQLVAI